MNDVVERIALDRLAPSPNNRRVGGFNEDKLAELAASIRQIGVQQPAVVRPMGDGYEIVAGERRWRASKLAGVEFLPCLVRKLTDAEALHIQIIENIQREDVHPLDEADGYERLRKDGGFDVEQIARECGRTPAHVYQRLKLLKLIPKVRQLLVDGKINAAIAINVARLEPEQQEEVYAGRLQGWAIENVTARDLAEWIKRMIMHDLSLATWNKNDADLVPAAGACATCAKRTGANMALFEDLQSKKDHCIDGACFESKGKALVAQRRRELYGKEHIQVADTWTSDRQNGVLSASEWEECKKSDPGAVRVLVVAGDKPGRLTYGKAIKATSGASKVSDEEKEKRRRVQKLQEARQKVLSWMFKGIHSLLIETKKPVPADLVRLAIQKIWHERCFDSQQLTAKALGWEIDTSAARAPVVGQQLIEKMDGKDLAVFLIDMALAPMTRPSMYLSSLIPTQMQEAARLVGINPEEQLGEICEEYGFTREELFGSSDEPEDEDEDDEA